MKDLMLTLSIKFDTTSFQKHLLYFFLVYVNLLLIVLQQSRCVIQAPHIVNFLNAMWLFFDSRRQPLNGYYIGVLLF